MRGFLQLTWTDIRLYFREPIGTFFTIAFPPLIVVLFGVIYGNDPMPLFGGRGSMDVSMPAYTAMVLGIVGFMSIPISISTYRESGVLRRFRSTPLKPVTFMLADVISNLLMMFVGVALLIAVGRILYHVAFDGNALIVAAAIVFSALAMFSIGYLIAAVAPTARAAQVIGMVIFYPMMFLSGATMPIEVLPESVQRVSAFLPLTYAVKLLKGLWFGASWTDFALEAAVLLGVLVVCTALAARFFRWE